jgi:hypothetical protein
VAPATVPYPRATILSSSNPSLAGGPNDLTVHIFVSYAREDKRWLDQEYRFNLIPFLKESLRRDNADFWYDKELMGGDEFKRRIESEIDKAQIALLMVSQHFLNSEFIETFELPRIAARAERKEMVVIPVLVEPCGWTDYPFLSDRQMVPSSSPLIHFTESEAKWADVRFEILDGLRRQVKRIREEMQAEPLRKESEERLQRERELAEEEKRETERKAREMAEQKAREDAERKARERAEQKACEDAERKKREEQQRKGREKTTTPQRIMLNCSRFSSASSRMFRWHVSSFWPILSSIYGWGTLAPNGFLSTAKLLAACRRSRAHLTARCFMPAEQTRLSLLPPTAAQNGRVIPSTNTPIASRFPSLPMARRF